MYVCMYVCVYICIHTHIFSVSPCIQRKRIGRWVEGYEIEIEIEIDMGLDGKR